MRPENSEAFKPPGLPASLHPSFKPMTYKLSAMSYLPDTRLRGRSRYTRRKRLRCARCGEDATPETKMACELEKV